MKQIDCGVSYIERTTGRVEREMVYGESAIRFLYGSGWLQKTLGRSLLHLFGKWPWVSRFYGWLQTRPSSKKKILPFIQQYQVDVSEFMDDVEKFSSFDDFFVRKLKDSARPIVQDPSIAVIPADGRYFVRQSIHQETLFVIKGRSYTVRQLLQDRYTECFDGGSIVLARLCPTDCHRFYFPVDGVVRDTRYIEGKLFSVNPIAVRDNPWIFFENRRTVTYIESPQFGLVAYIEIGATNVGSIHQTYIANRSYRKGEEKGYFSFGGSQIVLLFEPNRIVFDKDLVDNSYSLETKCLIGQSLGRSV